MSEICRKCSELTSKKENKNALSQEEIEHFVKCVVDRKIPDSQIDDMLRAMFNGKLNNKETTHLTRAMIDSGKIVWPDDMKGEIFVDKHSTGGVGDKVSLVLAPALAACGVKVPMLSGRGLEHTGGTLDKLESIPGFNVLLSTDKFMEVVREVGCCIAGQTENLVPADKILYARRDATQTVDCTGLIISSIMSKKVAESLTALVLDVKVGKGAFKKDEQSARELATKMVNAGNGLRVKTVAYLTEMDSPLGNMIGNSLEVAESIKCLHGDGPHDLIDLVIRLGGQLLFQVGKASNLQDGCDQINQTLHNGTAIAKFAAMMKAQGVDAVVADRLCTRGASLFNILPLANYSTEIRSKVSGYIHEIDAMQCALASIRLGAGRMEAGQDIRFGVGLELIAHIGQHITEDSERAVTKKLASAPKSLRQGLLRENPDSNEGKVSAIIEIQRTWRGYIGRANLYHLVESKVSKTAVYSGSKHAFMRQDDFKGYTGSGKEKSAARLRLEEYYRDYIQGLMQSEKRRSMLPSFEDFCATYIQDWWKDHLVRHPPPPRKPVHVEPVLPKRPRRLLNIQEAAAMIQKAWRRHIDIQVYRYYRDLINFKTRGNPSLMLRCINPLEAKMLDPASGIHIKFRLAGERFPPNIYYKIYTHRPIQDMCANSPKDYTKPAVKLKMAKDQHNKGRFEVNKNDMSGWYQRMDNNGWRLVSDRLIHHIMSDPVTWETSKKKYEFNHDKLQRKQDVEKRKKKKKIDWMKKMYKEGMLKAKSDDKETIQLIEGAAAGMVATVENYGSDALEDWEVDELLDWTTSLNFEDYQNGWKELATSAHSEKQIEDKMRLLTSTADPFEFTLSTGPSRYQSTQQSRNTPVSSVSSTGGRQQQAVS